MGIDLQGVPCELYRVWVCSVLYMSCNVAIFQLQTSEDPATAARDQALEMIEMFSFIPHLNKNILYDI